MKAWIFDLDYSDYIAVLAVISKVWGQQGKRCSDGPLGSSFLAGLTLSFLIYLWFRGRWIEEDLETEWSRTVSFPSSEIGSCQQGNGGNSMLYIIQQPSQAFMVSKIQE